MEFGDLSTRIIRSLRAIVAHPATVLLLIPAEEGGMLTYRCPTTARVVHSGIETSEDEIRRLGALRLSLWCPYCQVGHAILAKDTLVTADSAPSAA
jgi:hypothetical protein